MLTNCQLVNRKESAREHICVSDFERKIGIFSDGEQFNLDGQMVYYTIGMIKEMRNVFAFQDKWVADK